MGTLFGGSIILFLLVSGFIIVLNIALILAILKIFAINKNIEELIEVAKFQGKALVKILENLKSETNNKKNMKG